MAISTLEGVESIRVLRAAGNLKITGADRSGVEIDTNTAPQLTRNAGVAEIVVRDNATIAVPAGVAVEVEDLAGNLEVSDLATPFVVKRVRGNLHARRIGAISMRDTVSGNVSIKEAGSVEGLKVRGALSVESAHAITFSLVAGGFDCRAIDGEVAIEKISGSARLLGLHGPFIARLVGGHLEVEDAAQVEAGVVGGKVRASNLSGAIRIGKIGGKLAADNVAGEVAVGFVGGSARIGRVGGALTLEDVGGAVYLAGPFPADKTWSVRSRGRVNVEVDANASLELDAAAGWGRIRTYGVDAAGLKWLGRNHVHGPIGPDPAAGARLKLAVETRGADVIVASADARARFLRPRLPLAHERRILGPVRGSRRRAWRRDSRLCAQRARRRRPVRCRERRDVWHHRARSYPRRETRRQRGTSRGRACDRRDRRIGSRRCRRPALEAGQGDRRPGDGCRARRLARGAPRDARAGAPRRARDARQDPRSGAQR